jgi:acetyl/propionyl-CoA carboxylase alpha subunit
VRTDAGVYQGSEVTIHYDPMLAKLIVWAEDRPRALARLGRALSELRVEGIETTAPLFRALLADPDFTAGELDIAMLDRKLAAGGLGAPEAAEPADLPPIAAAVAHFERQRRAIAATPPGGGLRRRWHGAGRREAVRRGP